jgi:glycosyltransferase involved in cell wall biosynthesis
MITIAQHKTVEKVAVLIPAFCEEHTVGRIVSSARRYVNDVIVVDDASTDRTAVRAEAAGALVIRRETNGGKGASLTEGFKYVLTHGFDAVIALDADGFHDPDEIPKFLETYNRTHLPVLIGNRMADACRVTMVRRWTIRLMSYWLNRLLGVYVPDPPCGFRFYRCDVLPFLLAEGSSLPAEFETLLNIASRRIRVGSVRITKCSMKHKSMISPFRDLLRFARVLRRFYRKQRIKACSIRLTDEEE